MTAIDLSTLSCVELRQLSADVTSALASVEARNRKDALAAAEAAVQEYGFTLKDLIGGRQKSAKAPSAARYRHPENPVQTWTGRGRQPLWFKAALESGVSPEDMEIS